MSLFFLRKIRKHKIRGKSSIRKALPRHFAFCLPALKGKVAAVRLTEGSAFCILSCSPQGRDFLDNPSVKICDFASSPFRGAKSPKNFSAFYLGRTKPHFFIAFSSVLFAILCAVSAPLAAVSIRYA